MEPRRRCCFCSPDTKWQRRQSKCLSYFPTNHGTGLILGGPESAPRAPRNGSAAVQNCFGGPGKPKMELIFRSFRISSWRSLKWDHCNRNQTVGHLPRVSGQRPPSPHVASPNATNGAASPPAPSLRPSAPVCFRYLPPSPSIGGHQYMPVLPWLALLPPLINIEPPTLSRGVP